MSSIYEIPEANLKSVDILYGSTSMYAITRSLGRNEYALLHCRNGFILVIYCDDDFCFHIKIWYKNILCVMRSFGSNSRVECINEAENLIDRLSLWLASAPM